MPPFLAMHRAHARVGEHNAQKLKIAGCAACAHKRETVTADP